MLGDDRGLLSSLDEDVRGERLPGKLPGIIWLGLSGMYPTSRNSCSSVHRLREMVLVADDFGYVCLDKGKKISERR